MLQPIRDDTSELHQERLEEELAERRGALAAL
jgi:hypothetical protein